MCEACVRESLLLGDDGDKKWILNKDFKIQITPNSTEQNNTIINQKSMAWTETCKKVTCGIILVSSILVMLLFIANLSIFRIKLCENKGDLFHEDTGKCYKGGDKGPCGETLVFTEKENSSPYGGCSCAYKDNQRTLLYDNQTNKCYFIFTQAFCEDGFWLNVTQDGEPFCSENKCSNSSLELEGEIVPLKNGKCAILHKHTEGCKANEVVRFYKNSIYPSCRNPKSRIQVASINVPDYPCPIGSFRNIMGKCQPQIDIDFS